MRNRILSYQFDGWTEIIDLIITIAKISTLVHMELVATLSRSVPESQDWIIILDLTSWCWI